MCWPGRVVYRFKQEVYTGERCFLFVCHETSFVATKQKIAALQVTFGQEQSRVTSPLGQAVALGGGTSRDGLTLPQRWRLLYAPGAAGAVQGAGSPSPAWETWWSCRGSSRRGWHLTQPVAALASSPLLWAAGLGKAENQGLGPPPDLGWEFSTVASAYVRVHSLPGSGLT